MISPIRQQVTPYKQTHDHIKSSINKFIMPKKRHAYHSACSPLREKIHHASYLILNGLRFLNLTTIPDIPEDDIYTIEMKNYWKLL
jgi:hypothetical protein